MSSRREFAMDDHSSTDRSHSGGEQPALTIRGASVTLQVAHLAATDLARIEAELAAKVSQAAGLFRDAAIVIDLQEVQQLDLDVRGLARLFRTQGLIPVGVRNGSAAHHAAAQAAGLALLQGGRRVERAAAPAPPETSPAPPETPPPPPPAPAPAAQKSRLVTQPVRSGQRAFNPAGDLIVVASVNTGAEVLAAGNVHVYGPLRGRAMAGVNGDTQARILTTCMQAELVAIAGVYRSIESDLPDEVHEKPAQVFLTGDRLFIEPLAAVEDPQRKKP
jgi:septum site-determining protein MinC